MNLTSYSEDGVFHLFEDGHEILAIHSRGEIITRGRDRRGHIHVQHLYSSKLSSWLAEPSGTSHETLTFATQHIPDPEASLVVIPSMIAIFAWETLTHPVLITLEPLSPKKIQRILKRFLPVTAVFNAGRIYIPRGSEKLARGLR